MAASIELLMLEWYRWSIDTGPKANPGDHWSNKMNSEAYLHCLEPKKGYVENKRRHVKFQVSDTILPTKDIRTFGV